MNFKEEYKKSADSISPDKEAIDRMKAAVLAEIAKEPEKSAESRKPLPFKRIAIIGGAAAACAVITISAINLLPSISTTGDMVEEAGNSSAASMADAASYNSAANDSGAKPQDVSEDLFTEEYCLETDVIEETVTIETGAVCAASEEYITAEAAEVFPAEPSATGGQVNDIQTEQEEAQTVDSEVTAEIDYGTNEHADTTAPDFSAQPATDAAEKEPDGVVTESEPDMPDEAQDAGGEETAEASGFTDDGKENPATGAPGYLGETTESGETLDVGAFTTEEASCEATNEAGYDWSYEAPTPEDSIPKLVLTGKGWLTYDGERYNEDKEIKPAQTPELIVKARNVMDKRYYYVNLDGDILMLYDEKMNFIGAYRKR